MAATKDQIIASLRTAFNMEIETVINYLANSLQLEGVRAEFIKQALATDIQEELGHAQQLGNRIKQLGGVCSVPRAWRGRYSCWWYSRGRARGPRPVRVRTRW